MQGPALPVLSPSRFLDKSLTPTRLFSGSLGEIRASPEPSSSVRRRRLPGGAGVTTDWKLFWHRPQTVKNRLGWDRSERLLCANVRRALVDYLGFGKLTQRETDLPAVSPGLLDQHFSACQATRPSG